MGYTFSLAIILGLVILVSSVIFLGKTFLIDNSPKTVSIMHTSGGFVPDTVVIKKGDLVIFSTNTGKLFWPASDAHPIHSLFPAFDPKRPLSPEEKWEIVLDRSGTWNYHDHLNPQIKSTIIVKGKSNRTIKECLATSQGTFKAACWNDYFAKLISEKGINTAFSELAVKYNEDDDFKNVCHDIMHSFGDLAYYQFIENDTIIYREETKFCGYGFYHGFIEAAFSEFGPTYLSEGKRYCNAFIKDFKLSSKRVEENGRNACYHGLGHAIFDSLNSSLWGDDTKMTETAIGTCEGIFKDILMRAQCGSGVFNALAIAYNHNYYSLSYRKNGDYAGICDVQGYPYQRLCYMEVSHHYLGSKQLSFEDEIKFVNTLTNTKEAESLILGLMDTRVRTGISDINLDDMYKVCTSFSNEDIARSCVGGVIIGLKNGGPPGKEKELIDSFCELFPTKENYCTLGIPNSLGIYPSGFDI